MVAQFKINVNEFNDVFMNYIHEAFKGKDIEITITDLSDDTDYLNSSTKNREILIKNISDIENNLNLKKVHIQ